MTEPRTWDLVLPYTKPPLSLNSRQHHMVRWKRERQVRSDVMWLVRAARVPALPFVSVQLHYRPLTNRRRDTDNLIALLKPAADGLVAAGVVPDDTPEFMARPEPALHPHRRLVGAELLGAQVLWIELTEGGGRS